MSSLRQRLGDLASSFASSVLEAIRSASIEELLAESSTPLRRGVARPTVPSSDGAASPGVTAHPPGAPRAGRHRAPGRLARRSMDDIEQVVTRVLALLKQHPKGLRAEEIRSKLGLLAKEMPRPLKEGVDSGRLGKSGQKRATTYYAKGGGGGGGGGGVSTAGAGASAPATPAKKRGRGGKRRQNRQ